MAEKMRYFCTSCGRWWLHPIYARQSHNCPLCGIPMHMRPCHGDDADLADAPINFARINTDQAG
jgi:DNA-directed RNA polymerase subunit RPC12/RpoP